MKITDFLINKRTIYSTACTVTYFRLVFGRESNATKFFYSRTELYFSISFIPYIVFTHRKW